MAMVIVCPVRVTAGRVGDSNRPTVAADVPEVQDPGQTATRPSRGASTTTRGTAAVAAPPGVFGETTPTAASHWPWGSSWWVRATARPSGSRVA